MSQFPSFEQWIQTEVDNLLEGYVINVSTRKVVKENTNFGPRYVRNGKFIGTQSEKYLVDWAANNVFKDPLEKFASYNQSTDRLFDPLGVMNRNEPTLERVMQVVQILWNRVADLERENKELSDRLDDKADGPLRSSYE